MTIRNENDKDFGDSKNQNKENKEKMGTESLIPNDDLGNAFDDRFEAKYNIPFDTDEEISSIALWFIKRKKLITSFKSLGYTYREDWHVMLIDLGYEVSKATLGNLLRKMHIEKLIGLVYWFPKSKKMNLIKIYYDYSYIKEVKTMISDLNLQDSFYYSREKKKKRPKDIVDHNFEVKKETILREKGLFEEIREIERTFQTKRKEETDKEKKKREQDIKNGFICPSDATKDDLRKMKNQITKYTAGKHMGKEVNWLDRHFENCKMPFNKHKGLMKSKSV